MSNQWFANINGEHRGPLTAAVVLVVLLISVLGCNQTPSEESTTGHSSNDSADLKPDVATEDEQPAVPTANDSTCLPGGSAADLLAAAVELLEQYASRREIYHSEHVLRRRGITISSDPTENVRSAISLLEECLRRKEGNEKERKDAEHVLEYAKSAISPEKAIEFLTSLDDYHRQQILDRESSVFVPAESLNLFGQAFGRPQSLHSIERKLFSEFLSSGIHFPEDRPSAMLDVTGKHNSNLLTAFHKNLLDNAEKAVRLVDAQRMEAARKRKAARPENPALTDFIFLVSDNPKRYEGKCMYFDDVKVHGGAVKKGDTYRLPITGSRGKYYSAHNDEVVFECSRSMANQLRLILREDEHASAKISCDMYLSTRDGAWAKVYKIDIYNRGGRVAQTIREGSVDHAQAADNRNAQPASQARLESAHEREFLAFFQRGSDIQRTYKSGAEQVMDEFMQTGNPVPLLAVVQKGLSDMSRLAKDVMNRANAEQGSEYGKLLSAYSGFLTAMHLRYLTHGEALGLHANWPNNVAELDDPVVRERFIEMLESEYYRQLERCGGSELNVEDE